MRAMSARLCVVVGLLGAACVCAGGTAAEAVDGAVDVEGVWPFFYRLKSADRTEWEALGPLAFFRTQPEGSTYGLRPLFNVHKDVQAQTSTWQVLYPLSYFRTAPRGTRHYAFPFYYHDDRVARDGRRTSVSVVFPLFWWGNREGKRWRLVLFVGGTARGLLGKDEIYYTGFTYIRERTGDYVVHYYMSPFVSIGRGGGRRMLRVWPFYGRTEQAGKWWNGFVLWPFFTYGQREGSATKSAADYFSFWPFYGQSRARDGSGGSTHVLWPFFYWAWGTRKNYRAWDMPFPFVRGKRTDDVQTFNVWPLYGQRRWKTGTERYVLWPLLRTSRVRTKSTRYDDVKVFPFVTRVSRRDAKKATSRSYWLVWPFWRSRSEQAKGVKGAEANSLQFAWFANSESYDRNFNALLGLYEHAASPDGRRSTRLLWRCFRSERGPGWRHLQLGPLASWTKGGGLTKASYLLGLVQTGRNHGKRGWRLFYIPFGASLRTPCVDATEGKAGG